VRPLDPPDRSAYDDDLLALHIVAHHAVRAGDARWKEHLALASEEVQHRGLTWQPQSFPSVLYSTDCLALPGLKAVGSRMKLVLEVTHPSLIAGN